MATIPYQSEIVAAANRYGIDLALLAGLVKQESGFNPKAGSGAGAKGLTQLMPGTAAGLGVTDVYDPAQSLDGGAKYLAQQLKAFKNDVTLALAAYNAGPGAVARYGGVPPFPETQKYVKVVKENADEFRKLGLTAAGGAVVGDDASDPTGGDLAPDTDSGGGMFAPLLQGALKGLVWTALILGGAALVIVGVGRIATARPQASS